MFTIWFQQASSCIIMNSFLQDLGFGDQLAGLPLVVDNARSNGVQACFESSSSSLSHESESLPTCGCGEMHETSRWDSNSSVCPLQRSPPSVQSIRLPSRSPSLLSRLHSHPPRGSTARIQRPGQRTEQGSRWASSPAHTSPDLKLRRIRSLQAIRLPAS